MHHTAQYSIFELGAPARLAPQIAGVELRFDRIIFDIKKETRRFRNGEAEEKGKYAWYDADANDPSPHNIYGADEIGLPLASACNDNNKGNEIAGKLAEWLHEKNCSHHASSVLYWSESAFE